jgi:hypothetical protein
MNGVKDTVWPKVGVRVPCESTTFDDLKLDSKGKDKPAAEDDAAADTPVGAVEGWSNDATDRVDALDVDSRETTRVKDAKDRAAFEVHFLAFPLIPTPPAPFCDGGDPPSDHHAHGDGGEFDDEGNLFRASYEQCSFPDGGRPARPAPPKPITPAAPASDTPAAGAPRGSTATATSQDVGIFRLELHS